jgi:hypothetical protein
MSWCACGASGNRPASSIVIAGLDPAIDADFAATLSIADIQHGCAGQARA